MSLSAPLAALPGQPVRRPSISHPFSPRGATPAPAARDDGALALALREALLDQIALGLCLVTPGGELLHANAPALAALAGGDPLRRAGPRLAARDPAADRALRAALAACDTEAPRPALLPLRDRDAAVMLVAVRPLRLASDHRAVALVLQRPRFAAVATDVIGDIHGLTPTERRVLDGIVALGGVPEVAAALGVAPTTVKTHLGRLFDKTGATRQADLVKLMAAHVLPLVGEDATGGR
jgi:DNA-binding CsgD family transcriptional regulator